MSVSGVYVCALCVSSLVMKSVLKPDHRQQKRNCDIVAYFLTIKNFSTFQGIELIWLQFACDFDVTKFFCL